MEWDNIHDCGDHEKKWIKYILREFNLHMDADYRNPSVYVYKDKELEDFLKKSKVWNGK